MITPSKSTHNNNDESAREEQREHVNEIREMSWLHSFGEDNDSKYSCSNSHISPNCYANPS